MTWSASTRTRTRSPRCREGEIPIFEPGLDEIVAANVRQERLLFSQDIGEAVKAPRRCSSRSARPRGAATATPICPSSMRPRARSPRRIDGFTVVVTKSTVPVGTGDEVERIIRETRPDADFVVVSNPEFLREGAAISDFKRPDRIVVGTTDPRARSVMSEIYRPLNLELSRRCSSSIGALRN